MSLGDNTELAGDVRVGASRWLFFPNTTVTAGGERIVSMVVCCRPTSEVTAVRLISFAFRRPRV